MKATHWIAVCGNSFSDSYIGDDKIKRTPDDRDAAGLTLEDARDVAIVGNLFSSVRPKALATKGKPSSRILFTDNVLINTAAESENLSDSAVEGNLRN